MTGQRIPWHWRFECEEMSAAVWRSAAEDGEGTRIERSGFDPDALEKQVRVEARTVAERKLEAALSRFKNEPPPRMRTDVGDEVRADLIALDTHAAGVASRAIADIEIPADWLTAQTSLRSRVAALQYDDDAETRRDGDALGAFLAQIEELLGRSEVVVRLRV